MERELGRAGDGIIKPGRRGCAFPNICALHARAHLPRSCNVSLDKCVRDRCNMSTLRPSLRADAVWARCNT
jgi:hypothetical protein